jgi:cation:H+ antiporter
MLINVVGIILGLALLTKGADLFVDGASGLATKLGIPPLVVGLTIVALGTSAPEAAISIAAATQAAGSITIANVLGSNIVNTLVILGVVALVAKVPVRQT